MTEETYPNSGMENSTNEQIYRITGKVIDGKSRLGIPGLRVEARDNNFFCDGLRGSAVTDANGIFLIITKKSDFSGIFGIFFEQCPDLYFKIYQNDELAYSTYNSTFWDVCNPEFDIVIELDLPSCDCGNPGESLLRVYGIVRNESGESSAGFLVKAFDVPDTLLGETLLDKNSRYQIDFSKAAYKNTAAGRDGPNLQVNVYDQNSVKIGQSRLVNNAGRVTELNVEVNTVRYRVYGTVLDGQGAPLRNHTVRAFDRDLRSEETLGNKQTDETGFYEIKYTPEQFQRSEKGLADLIVRVYDEHANEMISSKTIFNAKPETMVNLSLPGADPRGLPEFDNYVRELTPLLGSVPQYELTNPDIAFLAAETGIDPLHLLWLAESARRHLETPIIDQFVYYGLFRQNLPTALDELLAQELPILRDALEKSSQSHIIRLLSSDEIDAIIAKFHRLQADQATEPGGTETSSLGDLLRTVLTDAASIRAVAQLYITHNNRVSAEFFAGLTSLNLFSSQKLTDIRLALQLGELTGIYLPLVRELQSMANTDPLYAPTGDLSPYVRLTLEDWKGVLRRKQSNGEIIGAPSTVEGDDIEAKIVNYAISLSEQLEGAFPSTTIIRRIEADSGSNSPFKDTHADLMTFFATNPSFDLGRLPLDIYLATDTEAKLAGVENRETFIKTFKALQRVVRLTPNYEAIQMFMTDGLHSAQALTALGQHYFINQYSYYLGGEKKALSVYVTAQFIQNTAMAVYMKHSPTFQSPLPYVMGGQPISIRNESFKQDQAQVQALPDWTALFGSLALCECRHCRSLYSPAAYLVDILNFIKKVPSSSEGTTALDILLMQRPDIAHSELTCNNSNTPMPYVDLVNEILEAKVAPQELTLNWDEAIVMNLDQQIIDDSLLADFENNNYILTDKASVRVDSEGWNWTILDTSWAFVLTNDGDMSGSISATVWPQTSWSAKELKANPEHTHIGAYNKLRTAVYPWSLPFNLPIEEARVYLRHLAVRRYDLLNIFMREASLKQKYAVAYEYLGLTTEEAAIINGSTIGGWTATNPGPWDFWGLSEDDNDIPDPVDSSVDNAQGTWVEVLKRVSIFLQRSGLSYRELLNLLDTRYLNPRNVDSPNGCSFAIVAADGSNPMTCNASELALSAFEDDSLEYEEMFDRAHRFVRLARKLSWALHDLDKAITALKPEGFGGNFNKFLVQLSRIQQLSIEKNIPVVNLLSFWADIDYTPYVDHLTDGEPVIPSLYAQMFLSKTLAATKFPENPEDLIDQKISEHTAAIAAALGIGADDIDRLRTNPRVIPLIQDSADQTKYIQDDDLTLVNLSRLYRHALLARIVKLPIPQYLTTLELITPDPFHSTLATMNFISAADRIANAGFSVDDLDYLLRHTADSKSELAITDADIGAALDVIRADLGQIAAENTFVGAGSDDNVATTDPDGDLTRKKLALLNWSAVEINTVVAILNNTYLFDTRLDSLNLSIRFPVQLANRISYDATAHRLQFKGVMSSENKNQLLASPNDTDQPFKEAVEALYNAPRSFMKRQMRRFSVPVFESTKFSPLSNVLMPTPVKNKVFSVLYDETNGVKKQTLRCIGIMTEAEKKILYRLSNAKPYVDAITELYNKPETMPLQPLDKFLTVVQVDDLFDAPEPAQRFLLVLKRN
jgi:hypothetical protein